MGGSARRKRRHPELDAVTQDMSGNQYRLIVTDASGYSVVTRAATLTVKQVPHTGDVAPLIWWVIGAATGLLGLGAIIVKRKRHTV